MPLRNVLSVIRIRAGTYTYRTNGVRIRYISSQINLNICVLSIEHSSALLVCRVRASLCICNLLSIANFARVVLYNMLVNQNPEATPNACLTISHFDIYERAENFSVCRRSTGKCSTHTHTHTPCYSARLLLCSSASALFPSRSTFFLPILC